MMYDTIFARSFSRHEQKKLGYGAFVGFLIIVLSLCTVFKPYLGPIHDLNLKLSIGIYTKMLMVSDTSSSQKMAKAEDIVANILVEGTKMGGRAVPKISGNYNRSSQQIMEDEEIDRKKVDLLCTSEERTEFCQTKGDIRVHGKSSSVYIVSPKTTMLAENNSWRIRPYARKDDADAMTRVREWLVKPVNVTQEVRHCTQSHSIPAVIFSTGGYTGNHFHEFTDIIIPLFLTSRHYNGEVQFIITNYRSWWIAKHQPLLNKLSNYKIMDIDKDDEVHCFSRVTVGLKRYQKELSFDPQKHFYSMKDFRDFLRSSYSLKRVEAIKIRDGQDTKPRLLILSRKRSRSFTNTAQIAKTAESLGFDVIIREGGGSLWKFADVVNSCDVLLGVHGAGLTNILFLPENAVFIQVVPYGRVEWLSTNDFGKPSKDMNLKYLEYKIRLEESTLIQQYPLDHMLLKEPPSSGKLGWEAFRSVYLVKQNVKLDVNRFRPILQEALELLHQ